MARDASSHPMLCMLDNFRQSLQQPHRRCHKAGCRASCAGQPLMVTTLTRPRNCWQQPAEAQLLLSSVLAGNLAFLLQLSQTTAGLQGFCFLRRLGCLRQELKAASTRSGAGAEALNDTLQLRQQC